jgi:hypothetical protein
MTAFTCSKAMRATSLLLRRSLILHDSMQAFQQLHALLVSDARGVVVARAGDWDPLGVRRKNANCLQRASLEKGGEEGFLV